MGIELGLRVGVRVRIGVRAMVRLLGRQERGAREAHREREKVGLGLGLGLGACIASTRPNNLALIPPDHGVKGSEVAIEARCN